MFLLCQAMVKSATMLSLLQPPKSTENAIPGIIEDFHCDLTLEVPVGLFVKYFSFVIAVKT